MLIYYCWTNTLLINSLRLKNGNPEEQADLIVLMLPRISSNLVDHIEKNGCFRRVIRIQPPKDRIFGPFYTLFKFFRYRHYKQEIKRQLPADAQYDRIFSGALWSYTIILHDILREKKGNVPISLIEEGAANYGGTLTAYWCDPKGRQRDWLFRKLFYRDVYYHAAEAIDSMFLLCPEACLERGNLQLYSFPPADQTFEMLVKAFVKDADTAPYLERKVAVFLQPENKKDQKKSLQIIQTLANAYGPQQVIVRPHPDARNALDSCDLDPAIQVDRSNTPFELIMTQVDWTDKIMVSRASSCLFFPPFALQQQPRVFFMYELFSSGDEFLIQKLSQRLQLLYNDPKRVHIPADLQHFQQMLRE